MIGYRKLIALALGVLGNVAVAYSGVDTGMVDQMSTIITSLVAAFMGSNLIAKKMNKPKVEEVKS